MEEEKRREERGRFDLMMKEEREREEWRRREERDREERRRDEMAADRRISLQMMAYLTAGRATLPMPPRVTVTMQPRYLQSSCRHVV